VGPQGLIIDRLNDFFLVQDDGVEKYFGYHQYDGWDASCHGMTLIRDGNFYQLQEDGTEKLLGIDDADELITGPTGLVFNRGCADGFDFYFSKSDGIDKFLGRYLFDNWNVGTHGIVICKDGNFFLVVIK
jgi:hypothetical protein